MQSYRTEIKVYNLVDGWTCFSLYHYSVCILMGDYGAVDYTELIQSIYVRTKRTYIFFLMRY